MRIPPQTLGRPDQPTEAVLFIAVKGCQVNVILHRPGRCSPYGALLSPGRLVAQVVIPQQEGKCKVVIPTHMLLAYIYR